MKRPKQLPAVDRNSRKCAALPVGANVRPSDWASIFKDLQPPLSSLILDGGPGGFGGSPFGIA